LQRDAAGSLRVSLMLLSSLLPPRLGARGLNLRHPRARCGEDANSLLHPDLERDNMSGNSWVT
jgi:hypothetical protein